MFSVSKAEQKLNMLLPPWGGGGGGGGGGAPGLVAKQAVEFPQVLVVETLYLIWCTYSYVPDTGDKVLSSCFMLIRFT